MLIFSPGITLLQPLNDMFCIVDVLKNYEGPFKYPPTHPLVCITSKQPHASLQKSLKCQLSELNLNEFHQFKGLKIKKMVTALNDLSKNIVFIIGFLINIVIKNKFAKIHLKKLFWQI